MAGALAIGWPPVYVPGIGQLAFAYRKPLDPTVYARGIGTLNEVYFPTYEPLASAPLAFGWVTSGALEPFAIARRKLYDGTYSVPPIATYG